ncbi:heterodisulfide reductase subunit B2 [Candidatus Hakubella thermalkaliphila]|uniref:Heterodisulfide reductase subunit B2 n=1 Tax=Candidatus Hakubella thermalkaliphila TaxID=2754717 RepID=A0A6V8PVG5_9ACTN|nr:CoB--CoM heterodisulfide reductase iron-sulfur subunit B family protein [Candidatus Hakubella thermalkaliphila]GFP35046.1 heterodisulfide reductase subunit B2 [Candidatus Hakubella thermalkaliphila]
MKVGYYPGCTLNSTAEEYNISAKKVCASLGIELVEIPDWTCCGASAAHAASHLMAVALPLKNLLAYQKLGLDSLALPCAACYSRFKAAAYLYPAHEKEMEEIFGEKYDQALEIRSLLNFLTGEELLRSIKERVKEPLTHLRVVAYYGCLLTRPPRITGEEQYEYPTFMEELIGELGAEPLDWSYKTECCGMSFSLSAPELVIKLCGDILQNAKDVGANVIAVACPLCHANLDTRQREVEKRYQVNLDLPILYFTQLIGLALGMTPAELGLRKHLVPLRV